MRNLKCKDGKQHEFDVQVNVCERCGCTIWAYLESKKKKQTLQRAFRTIMDNVNGGDAKSVSEALIEEMHRTHRTLQQAFFRMLQRFIEGYSKMKSDARNEASVEWFRKVSQYQEHLPLI